MTASILKGIKIDSFKLSLKISLLFFLGIITLNNLVAQPGWIPPYPTITNITAINAQLNIQLDNPGTVYWAARSYNATPMLPADVKAYSTVPPSGSFRGGGSIVYTAGNVGSVINALVENLISGVPITVNIVTENLAGTLLGTTQTITITPPPCPKINVLTGFLQDEPCVNRGADVEFQFLIPNPATSGILKGTQWYLDWGDGTIVNYTSTANNDVPFALFTHTYTSITDCNYIFSNTIRNPCGELRSVQYIAVVHGRDIPSDGDGVLRLVNNATGSSLIQICEGAQATITIRDNSTWNCQNPTLPGGFTAIPNLEPRNIEWLYGREPGGAIRNTITGTVTISSLGNAPQASGRISPDPYGPNSLSEAITIPATCKAGEYFRIYLKNWNKCNWPDPEFVNTFVDILVVAAPPAPTVANKTICSGGNRTLTVTSPVVGTIYWYSNPGLTTQVATGTSYTQAATAPGIYNYWVVDRALTGLLCQSPPTQVSLVIREPLTQPGVITGPANSCPNVNGLVYSVAADPPVMPFGGATEYVWSVPAGLTIASGQGTRQITVNVGSTTGSKTISVYTRYTTAPTCNSSSRSTTLTVYSTVHNAGAIGGSNVCAGSTVNITNVTSASTGTPASSGPVYSWERSPGPAFTVWTPLTGSAATFSEVIATPGIYRYRRTATFGCGTPVSTTYDITVYSTLVNGGAIGGTNICAGGTVNITNTTAASTGTPASAGPTYSWDRAPGPAFNTWTALTGSGATFSETMSTPGTYRYRRTATYGCGTPATATRDIIVNPLPTPVITGNQYPCLNYTETYSTPMVTGHTYSWSVTNGNIVGPSTNNTVTVNWNIAAGAASVTVTETITATGCSFTTPNFVIVVNPSAPGAAGPITGLTNVCYGQTGVTYSITAVPNASTYTWSVPAGVSIVSGQGTTSLVVDFAPGAASPRTISVLPSNGCGDGTASSINVNIYAQLTPGTIGANQAICYNTAPAAFTNITPPSGGTALTYQWQKSPAGLNTWTNVTGGTGLTCTDPDLLTASTDYRRAATSGAGCGTVYSNIVTVTVYGQLNGGTIGSNQSICYNTAPAAFTNVTSPSGGTGLTYQWEKSPSGLNTWTNVTGGTGLTCTDPDLLTANTDYRRATISASGCGTVYSNIVTVTVYGQLTPGSIGSNQSICYNTAPALFTNVTSPSGGTGLTYQWQKSPAGLNTWSNVTGGTGLTCTDAALLTANTDYRRATISASGCGTVYSNIVTVSVYGQLTPGSIGSNQSICYNTSPAAFTSVTNPSGGTGLTYQWQKSPAGLNTWTNVTGGTGLTCTDPDLLTANTDYRRATISASGCGTVYSNIVTVTVYGQLTPGSIGSNQSICYNTAPALFTNVTSPSGGTGLTYQWQKSPAGLNIWTNVTGGTGLTCTDPDLLTVNTDYRRATISASGCGTVYSNIVTVTIKHLPAITPGQNPTVCSGNALNYQILLTNFTNPGDNVTFTWPAPIHSPGISGGTARPVGSIDNITDTYTNISGGIGTVTYAVTPLRDGCVGPTVNVVVNVGSEPVLDPNLNNFACSGSPVGLILKEAAGSVVPSHYNIISRSVAAGLNADAGNVVVPNATAVANYVSNDRFTNLTGVNLTVTYRVQPVLAPDCFGDPVDVVITIRPQPVIQPGQIKTVCSGVAIGREILLIPANTPAGTVFNWNAPLLSDLTVQGTAGVNVPADPSGTLHINDQINNFSIAPITATYTVTPTSSFGCVGTSVPVIITVNPEPMPQPISGRDKICTTDKNIVYNVNPVAGSTFTWTVDPTVGIKTFDFNTNAILIDAAAAPGTGNITVFETNSYGCTGDPSTLLVQVYTQAAPENIAGPVAVCANSTHTYSVTNRAGSVYNWTLPGGAAIIGNPSLNSIDVIFGNVGGTILVRETNAAGCVTNHNPLAVTVNPLPTAQISGTTTICEGGSGTLSVNFTGTAPYTFTYAINGVAQAPVSTSADPYSLNVTIPGNYTIVNVTDATACTNVGIGSGSVTYYPKPTGVISGTTELCNGNSTNLTMTFTGTAPYTFIYTDGTTQVTVNNHPTAIYTVSVSPVISTTYTLVSLTDGNGCTGVVTGSAIITVNDPPAVALTGTNLTCYNDNTGAVALTATGNGPFGYSWTGPDLFSANIEDISGLKAGVYVVVVTDTKGCSTTSNITLTQPTAVSGSIVNQTNVLCNGGNNGSVTIAGSGGVGPYLYKLDAGAFQPSGSFNTLSAGTYVVTVQDANLCTATVNVVITQPASPLTVTTTQINVLCNGNSTGSATATESGGTGPYSYSWNTLPVQATATVSNLTAGNYTVTVTDNNGCTTTSSVTITEPTALALTTTQVNVLCYGNSTGSATVLPTGGTGTYTYSWNTTPVQTTATANNLAAGTYTVTVRDGNNCIATANVTITEPLAPLTLTTVKTDVTCNGGTTGSATVTPAGGTTPYTYAWNSVPAQTTATASNLAAGTYTVIVTDGNGCSATTNVTITQPPALAVTTTQVNVLCNGNSTGSATATASGGTGPYSYSWNTLPVQATATASNLAAGNYTVTVTDNNGCITTANVTITQPVAPLAISTNQVNVLCFGGATGTATAIPSGGTGPYTYSWNTTPAQTTATAANLIAGTYQVIVTDNNGCTETANVTITEPLAPLTAILTKTDILCYGNSTGSATAAPAGGTAPYSYSWNSVPVQTASTAINLPAGTYTVTIRDANNCTITESVTLLQPASPLALTTTKINVDCNGNSTGSATVNHTGGTGPFTYSWSTVPEQTTATAINLSAGSYTVVVTDNNGCTANTSVIITQPPVLTVSASVVNVLCNGNSTGSATATVSGGTAPYTYSWNTSPVQTTAAASNLAAGSYTVTVTDNNGCTALASVTITEPTLLTLTTVQTNVLCNGNNTGSASVIPSGGTAPYSYSWNTLPVQTGPTATNLAAGTYMATVTDKNGCIATINVTITEPPALTLDLSKVDILCNGSATGSATATPSGGTTPYFYNWYSNPAMTLPIGQFTATAGNLAAGTYYVKVNDLNGCVITGNITIVQPPALNASITSQTNVLCFGGQNGSFTVTADPATGTLPFEYSIDGGGTWQPAGTFTNLVASVYTVFVKDANGCTKTVTVTITQPSQLIASVTNVTNVSCFGNSNGSVTIAATLGTGTSPYSYSSDGGTNWQPTGTFTGLAAGSYTFSVRDANGCRLDIPVTVTEPALLELTPTPDVILNCFGDKTGTGTFYAIGGTLPYTFSVTNNANASIAAPGFNTQSFFAAGVGSVTVQVTDSKGCTAQATINLTEPALLTPGSIGNNQVLCTGDNPAEIASLTAPTGGPAAHSYQWQYATTSAGPFMPITGATSATYTPAAGATMTLYYRRMVTSGMCPPVYSNTVEIVVNPRPVAILSGGATICPGDNAILKVNLPVGTGPFTLDIENYPGITVTGYASDADITVSPAVTTTYRLLRVRDANGCEIVAPSANLMGTATVTVRALPAITVEPVDEITCEFGMVDFNLTATGSDLTYQWYVDDGGGFDPVIDGGIYFGSQTSTLYLFGTSRLMDGFRYRVDVTGCSNTVPSSVVNLTVNTAPEIIVQPKDSTICQGQDAAFSIIAQGDALAYLWQVNKGAGFVDVVNDANFNGYNQAILTLTNVPGSFNNYIFRVKVSGTCGTPLYSNFVFLRVNMPPTVTLNPVNRSVCENGGPVYFTGNGSGMIDSLRWQVFTGGVWTDIYDNAVYSGATSQQLALVNVPLSYNGNQYRLAFKAFCANSYTNPATLTVNANPIVAFPAPVNACGGVPIVLNGNPSGGSGSYNQHTWTGDVGPLNNYFIQSPTFNSPIAGSYFLNYKVRDTNGCFANDTLEVIVDAPDATFAQDLTLGCTPLTVTFTKDMTGLPKFWWKFGDGSPVDSLNASPTHIFTNITPGSIEYREVELKVRSTGGCYDTFKSTVTVYPEVDAAFTPSTLVVCSGKTITFTSTPGASKYFWEYGDGASGYAANVSTHLYTNLTTNPLVLTVRLTTTSYYNCTSTETVNITVMPVPLPQFTAAPPTQTYNPSGNPVTFTNMTNAGTWTWSWRFGDGGTSTIQNPSHTYNGVGSYNVSLMVSNGTCTDSVIHPVTILPIPPIADFDSIPSGCMPLQVNIVNTSQNLAPGTTYFWDFGDGNTSTVKSPNYVYTTAGTFRVTLIVTGPGGTDTKSQIINVYPAPKAYFEISPTFVFVNDERVRCFNLSSNADYYIWEFGDGDTSHVKDPYHQYLEEGVYDVTLHAYSLNGCYDTYVLSPGVTVEPAGVLRFATVFTPNKEGPQDITSLPTGGEQVDQFFYPPIREKVIGYKLQIFNRWGTLIFESHDINIPWNGYYKGKLCKQGVYVWYVEGKYQNGQPFKQTGDITLLH